MRGEIPSIMGLLAMAGCSDAAAVGNTVAKVCKQDCECPTSDWNEVSHCKQACEGYATLLQALTADEETSSEPCDDLRKILNDLEKCARQQECGPERDACLGLHYNDLYSCWPGVFQSYYGDASAGAAQVSGGEIMQQLMSPIPGALPPEVLHSATRE